MKPVSRAKLLKEFEKETREALLSQIENSLRKKYPELFLIYREITQIHSLPERNECVKLMREVDRKFGGGVYGELLMRKGYFQVVHNHLANDLTQLLNLLDTRRNVEICAGMGKISYWVKRGGIEITATDSGVKIKGDERYVKRMSYKKALEKFDPQTVVAAWPMPYDARFVGNIMKHPSVKNLIILGKGGFIARKYGKSILNYGEIVPLHINTSPSAADSTINNTDYGPNVKKSIKKFFQFGESDKLHQSILIRAVRK